MVGLAEWPCWQIRQCPDRCDCRAGLTPDRPCWEVVGGMDYCLADICSDCLVYLIKHGKTTLSEHDLNAIRSSRENSGCCSPIAA